MQLNSDEIQQILPHRYPFLLVDRITECEPGKKACGIKCVSANEMHFVGHFPQKKVMREYLLLRHWRRLEQLLYCRKKRIRDI